MIHYFLRLQLPNMHYYDRWCHSLVAQGVGFTFPYFGQEIFSQVPTQSRKLSSHDEAKIVSFLANQNDSSLSVFVSFEL